MKTTEQKKPHVKHMTKKDRERIEETIKKLKQNVSRN
jgi:hypothetical protein